ncbi:sugar phosphate isomerase/epimerase family protein [Nocardiopsis composta]|uniref:Sugar phosphate isomerase/epimerase n=1 Tax=Nocardiopsis composta TaxID=157465 RepID=A0A7W8VCQ3_9ACTN|nr:sugar phosphate isomerase/epimerase family protein [Nocardiopsis composta]MBB5431124.1 sugar phosphate isomerase/epimerase [Nocardiopsis composta]
MPPELETARPPLAGIGDEAAPGLAAQLAAVAELGWNRLELRTVDGVPIAEMTEGAFDRAAGAIRDGGAEVVGVAAKIGDWSRPATGDFSRDLAELEVLVRRCARLGTRMVRVMSYPSGGLEEPEWGRRARTRLRELAHRAEEGGLLLVHENCAGWAGESAERALDLLAEADSPALRLLFDTGNGVAHGYSGPGMLRRIIDRVAHVHVKDAVTAPDGGTDYVLPGAGRAGVAESLRLLAAHGYPGALSIEPHLHLRPHLRAAGTGPGRGDVQAFTAYGRHLERLLAQTWQAGEAA